MVWKEELNNAKRVFKEGTPSQIVEYILDYYKWHIVAILCVACFLGSILYRNLTAKDCILQGILLNSHAGADVVSDLQNDFADHLPIDPSSEEIFLDTLFYQVPGTDGGDPTASYEVTQLLSLRAVSGEIDFIVGSPTVLNEFVYGQYCYDLSEVLSDAQIEAYAPYFLFYDKTVLEQIANADTDFMIKQIADIVFPDATKPESMEEPIPVMIDLSACEGLRRLYPDSNQDLAMVFIVNGKNAETALAFLEYLMQ